MRIKPRSKPHSFGSNAQGRLRSDRVSVRLILVIIGAALIVLTGIGVQHEYKALDPLLRRLSIRAPEAANGLQSLYIDLEPPAYQAMVDQQKRALQRGILQLEDQDWVPAQVRTQDQTIPVRVALVEGNVEHWRDQKWSLQVQVQEDGTLWGMHAFTLQSPAIRGYLNEWLYVEDLRRAQVLAPRYTFANLYVSGDPWGVYALEEALTPNFLADQGRREGVIVRFDDSLLRQRRTLYADRGLTSIPDQIAATFELPAFAQADVLDMTNGKSDPVLQQQGVAALDLLRAFQSQRLPVSQVFDPEVLGRYIAHADLWGACDGLAWHNERYYYDPAAKRLEPIGYRARALDPACDRVGDLAQYNDLAVMEAYAREVQRISRPEYLRDLEMAYGDPFERYSAALAQEFYPAYLDAPWDRLAERQGALSAALHPPQTVYARLRHGGPGETVDVQVANLLRYPVSLQQIQARAIAGAPAGAAARAPAGAVAVAIQPDWVEPGDRAWLHQEAMPSVILSRASEDGPRTITLHVPRTVFEVLGLSDPLVQTSTLQIVTRLVGVEDPVVVEVQRDDPFALSGPALPIPPLVEEVLDRHPFLMAAEQGGPTPSGGQTPSGGFLHVRPGTWQVEGDLVLPEGYGLWATQPVTLAFDREAVLLSTGPLLLNGPHKGDVRLVPKDDSWAGLVVLQADPETPSILHNVEIRGTEGIDRDGWNVTGGITFDESPVVLYDCRVLDSRAQRAFRVIRSRFEITGSEFGNASADAFHCDLAQGTIQQSAFHDIFGNGIDARACQVVANEISLLRVHRQGISADEGSRVQAGEIRASDVGIALAAKDASSVQAQDVRVAQAWLAGLAAYWENAKQGAASIHASDVAFEDQSNPALVQQGNRVTIDGVAVAASEVNVGELDRRPEPLAEARVVNYRLGPAVRLIGYDLASSKLLPGGFLELTLYWQARDRVDRDYTVFVHVVDESGQIVTQWDTMPRANTWPTTAWPRRQIIDDLHRIPLPVELPAGTYRIVLGMYLLGTGERLPVIGPNGEDMPQAAIPLDAALKAGL